MANSMKSWLQLLTLQALLMLLTCYVSNEDVVLS